MEDLQQCWIWVFEVKRSSAPTVSRGFHQAALDVGAVRKLLVAPVPAAYPGRDGLEVMGVLDAVEAVDQAAGHRSHDSGVTG